MSTDTTQPPGRRIFIDKQSPKAYHTLLQTSETVRATAADAGLDRTLVELITFGCRSSTTAPTASTSTPGRPCARARPPSGLGVLAAWRDTEVFTPQERATLALAEAVTDPSDAAAQESAYTAAREVLTDDQVSAVIWVAITINAFNRVSILSRHPVRAAAVQ